MSTRIYVPATLALLGEWHAAEALPPGLDPVVAEDDAEESEYAALMTAADASRALLGGAGKRVVVVAEVADPAGATGGVALRQVVAVHVDVDEAAEDDDDLAWFATQEIPHLLV